MVEISYKPIKQIDVHEIIKQPLSAFVKMKVRPQSPNTAPPDIRWADGIVFTALAYPPTERLVNDQVEGTVHWAHVEFAEMEDFQQMLSNQESGGSVMLTDYSNNTAVLDFVRWLKKQPQWFSVASAA